jgi:hypothetical protein
MFVDTLRNGGHNPLHPIRSVPLRDLTPFTLAANDVIDTVPFTKYPLLRQTRHRSLRPASRVLCSKQQSKCIRWRRPFAHPFPKALLTLASKPANTTFTEQPY